MDEAPPLRLGLLLDDGDRAPAWIVRLIERLAAAPWVTLSRLRTAGGPPGTTPANAWQRSARRPLFSLLTGFDEWLFRPTPDAWAYLPLPSLPPTEADACDLLLWLGGPRPAPALLAKTAVWALSAGDPATGAAPGLAEGLWRPPETAVTIRRLAADPTDDDIVARATLPPDPFSLTRHRNLCTWRLASLVWQTLDRQRRQLPPPLTPAIPPASAPLGTAGLAVAAVRHLAGIAIGKLRQRVRRDQWALLIHRGEDVRLDPPLADFTLLTPPADSFWADPFAIRRGDTWHLFFEACPYAEHRGHIAHLSIGPDGRASAPQRILERPYHLSYPFLFEHEGALYMMPETGRNHTLEVYRCRHFPDQWELHRVLMEGVDLVDATLHHQDGLWWLFANVRDLPGGPSWDDLHLWYADDPLSTAWIPHPANPIVSDLRTARPAGALFRSHGRLIRPSQDCTGRYGSRINLNEVRELTTDTYIERAIGTIEAGWQLGMLATHTLNYCDGMTLLDVQKPRWGLWLS